MSISRYTALLAGGTPSRIENVGIVTAAAALFGDPFLGSTGMYPSSFKADVYFGDPLVGSNAGAGFFLIFGAMQ